jgi:6,7-dimethyl-8-ribityllumazine synthase
MREYVGNLDGRGLRVGIALSRFHAAIGQRLLEGATESLRGCGLDDDAIVVVHVPGAWELAQALRWLVERQPELDALIALGTIIRGETPHFDLLAQQLTSALDRLAEQSGRPLTFGVLTCDDQQQALERAGGSAGNKGSEAALAAVELAVLRRALGAGS